MRYVSFEVVDTRDLSPMAFWALGMGELRA